MQDVYITLEEAAQFEGMKYITFYKRITRNPEQYATKTQARENGGKDQVLISVSSLSAKGRKAWRASQRTEAGAATSSGEPGPPPWYVSVDINAYIEQHQQAYYEAVEAANQVQAFIDYAGPEKRSDVAARAAVRLGISPQSLYRYQAAVLEADAWARRQEAADGKNYGYFRALALCRKPRDKDGFPSLTAEQRAIIENIWFDKGFSKNKPSVAMLYVDFEKEAARRGWTEYPSEKTVGRYLKCVMELPAAESALYLSAKGEKAWENAMQIKCKRDATTLEVMEYVVADAHTFDVWVEIAAPNGKKRAIRPVLVAWMDMRTRRILGCIVCEHSNTQIVEDSFIKMCYEAGSVPKYVHTDNGRDFANAETLGQDRKIRAMELSAMDSELKGFYKAMGAKGWSRSLPYKPWDKAIERAFGTFCRRYSRKFASYTGTLTASRTADKIEKDIPKMLDRGELLTLEEFHETLQAFLREYYDTHKHRGLSDAKEKWITPLSLWEHAPHYEHALPPRDFVVMLRMKPGRAKVSAQGITRFKTLYTAPELSFYVDKWVNIRWDVEDITRLYVYNTKTGAKICEATSAELLQFGDHVSQVALEKLHREKNRNKAAVREFLADMRTPPELRTGAENPVAGKLDLLIGHAPRSKVVALPVDKEYRSEAAARGRKEDAGGEFLTAKAEGVLKQLKAMGE